MIKVNIISTCAHCNGDAYLPSGEGEDDDRRKYIRQIPLPMREGSGIQPQWIQPG